MEQFRMCTPTTRPAPVLPRIPALAAYRLDELRMLRRHAQREEADLSYVRRLVQGRIDILRAELTHRTGESPAPGPGPGTAESGAPDADGPGPGTGEGVAPGSDGGPGGRAGACTGAGRTDACSGSGRSDARTGAGRPDGCFGAGRSEGRTDAGRAPLVGLLSEILADKPAPPRSPRCSARHLSLGTARSERYGRLVDGMLAEVALSDLAARTDDELSAAMRRLVGYEQQVSLSRQQLQHLADDCSAEITRRYREGEAQVDDLLA